MNSYPSHIITPIDANDHSRGFKYLPVVSFLLSLLSNVDADLIGRCIVYKRNWSRYMPWYSSRKGGGAITLGSARWGSITYTENFFSSDKEYYRHAAYGNSTKAWLGMSAHEVGHLMHAQRYGMLIVYLFTFIMQYIRHGHDKAPLEIEAEHGRTTYHRFNGYLNRFHNSEILENILRSNHSEEKKSEAIRVLWEEYVNHLS